VHVQTRDMAGKITTYGFLDHLGGAVVEVDQFVIPGFCYFTRLFSLQVVQAVFR